MALNLLRNSRVFFTTNVNTTTGAVQGSAHSDTTTSEIAVLEGFSFSQNTNSDTVTISEAGTTPTRGQRTFNTSLAPVDFSFSTYIRPYKSTNISSDDSVLWNAFAGNTTKNTKLTGGTITAVAYTNASNTLTITGTTLSSLALKEGQDVVINGITGNASATAANLKTVNGPGRVLTATATEITLLMHNPGSADVATTNLILTGIGLYTSPWSEASGQAILGMHDSNRNQLQKFGLLVVVDNVTYQIDNAALSQVTIDFGLDGIATAQWTGQATSISELAANITTTTEGTFATGVVGSYKVKNSSTTNYITNKLSTVKLKTTKKLLNIEANTPYYVALTGGNITINNNITYVTPATLGVVNTPGVYYTGTRAITGSMNAYLNTGTISDYTGGGTGNLLKDMLAAASTVTEPMFNLELAIGGKDNALRVELQMPSVSLGVPTIDAQAVISTAINFTAAASNLTGTATSSAYDLSRTNDLTVRYYAPAA